MDFKKFLPHLAASGIFLAVTLLYFFPLVEGKKLFQSDIAQFEGMSKEIQDYRKKTGEEALWTNSMFGGMPAFQISVLYKGNLTQYVDKLLQLGLPSPANLVFLCFLGFYFLLISMRINAWLSIAGALAFGFSSYFFIILETGHNSKAHAIAYMAPVVAGVLLTYRGKYLLGGVLTALFFALELNANHLQITYYLGLTLLVFALTMLINSIKEKTLTVFLKASAVVLFAVILALSTNTSILWSTYEYSKYTTRGPSDLTINPDGSSNEGIKTSGLDKDYATAWSYGISETFTLLIPGFYGGSSTGDLGHTSDVYKELKSRGIPNAGNIVKQLPVYWGDQAFTSGPVYVGAIVCFLFILGLFIVKGPFKWWLLLATIFSIILAWGRNFMGFNDLMLDYFPAYNKFRAVSMTLVIAEFTIPLLAFLAISKIFEKELSKEKILKNLKFSLYITGGILLIFIVFGGSLFSFTGSSDAQLEKMGWPAELIDALRNDRKWMLIRDSLRSLLFILLTAGLIWGLISQKIKKTHAFAIMILLVVLDMWGIDKDYLNKDSFTSKSKVDMPYQPTQADQQILADPDPHYRVFNTTARLDQDSRTSYFHKNLGGYHGAKLKRYQEMIDFHLGRGNMSTINMLNAKYVIVGNDKEEVMAQRNPGALGNAWFVSELKLVANADSEITSLKNFNPATTAVVDKKFEEYVTGFSPLYDSSASISFLEYKPDYLKYQTKSSTDQLAVFSEIYYDKGWNAFIDGKESPHFRVNYILRAMRIPGGEHTIEFKFEPASYFTGEKISFACSSVLLILVASGIVWAIKRKDFF